MNVAGFIPYLLSVAGIAVLSMTGAEAEAPTPQDQARIQAERIALSDELSGVAAIPATPQAAQAMATGADPRPAAVRALVITRELNVERWLEPGEWSWDAEAAAAAQGRATVVVNLRSRTLSVYKNGVELGRSSLLYGFGDHETPLGTFPVQAKLRDHRSRTYGGAPMPHTLRLTNDGVSLHGTARLADDLGTHGCIGLPEEFAALLFDQVGVGDQVIIWSGRAS